MSRSFKRSIRMQHVKVIFIGDGAVGKTSFLVRSTCDSFPGDYIPTCIDDFSINRLVNGIAVNLSLDDSAGQDEYDALRPLSYAREYDCVAICYDISRPSSLDRCISKWKPEVYQYLPHSPILLLGMKSDLEPKISEEDLLAAEMFIQPEVSMNCSSLNNINIDEVMDTVIKLGLAAQLVPKKDKQKCFVQ